jgi:hypothetical protein
MPKDNPRGRFLDQVGKALSVGTFASMGGCSVLEEGGQTETQSQVSEIDYAQDPSEHYHLFLNNNDEGNYEITLVSGPDAPDDIAYMSVESCEGDGCYNTAVTTEKDGEFSPLGSGEQSTYEISSERLEGDQVSIDILNPKEDLIGTATTTMDGEDLYLDEEEIGDPSDVAFFEREPGCGDY